MIDDLVFEALNYAFNNKYIKKMKTEKDKEWIMAGHSNVKIADLAKCWNKECINWRLIDKRLREKKYNKSIFEAKYGKKMFVDSLSEQKAYKDHTDRVINNLEF